MTGIVGVRAHALPALLAVLLLLSLLGCVSIDRSPVSDQVVFARQLTNQGADAVQAGNWLEAESLFARAIEACPVEERAHAMYAESLWRRKLPEDAIRHMAESVRLSAGAASRTVRLGEMQLASGAFTDAAQSAEFAIRADQRLASAHALKGDVLYRQGRWEDALASYHRALHYRNVYPAVQMAVAEIYRRQNSPLRALATLTALREQYSVESAPFDLLYLQGLVQKSLGRKREAAESFTLCARLQPRNADVLFHLAESKWQAGDPVGARFVAAEAVALAPHHVAGVRLARQLEKQYQELAEAAESPRGDQRR